MKTAMTIIIIFLSATTAAADFNLDTYNWNAEDGRLLHDRLAGPDLISLFTKEDVYIYQDTDIFGYTSRAVTDKSTPISRSD